MLTRRTFIQSTGALAAAAAGGTALTKPEIKEHGILEIRFRFLANNPYVVRDASLAEIRLSDVKDTLAVPGRVRKVAITVRNGDGRREEGFLYLLAKDGNIMFAVPGVDIRGTLAWTRLADVQKVL